jgi:NADH-quinone oxidoreductase subunit G
MAQAQARQRIPAWDDVILRASVQQQKGPFFVATPDATKLDDLASETCRAAPEDLARLGMAVAHAIDPEAPDVEDLAEPVRALAGRIATSLLEGDRPLVVSGITCGSDALIEAAANVAFAIRKRKPEAKLCFTVPDCNSLGLAYLPDARADADLDAVRSGRADTLVVVENDLYRDFGEAGVDELLRSATRVIAIDSVAHRTTEKADLVLPAATFAESSGTLVNNEGRAQRFYQVFPPSGAIRESWRWLGDLIGRARGNGAPAWADWDRIVADLAASVEDLRPIAGIAPPAGYRQTGLRIARQTPRCSGRTAIHAHLSVHEPRPPADGDTPLAYSMEGSALQPPAALVPRYWAPGWNSCQALNKFQIEIGGHLRGGDGGVRLLPPAAPGRDGYYAPDCPPFERRAGQFHIIPAYHIFGSEELSALSPGIAELAPSPYLGLNPREAERLPAAAGQRVTVHLERQVFRLPVLLRPALPDGVATVPAGLRGMPGLSLPAWGRVVVEGTS